MTILSGSEIAVQLQAGHIRIDPFDPSQLNPVSYDVRLGERIVQVLPNTTRWVDYNYNKHGPWTLDEGARSRLPHQSREVDCIDSREPCKVAEARMFPASDGGHAYLLEPGHLYLGHTAERIWTDSFVPTIDGKSSIGRLGQLIHVTAGYGEPGFDGQWTLELVALGTAVILYPGMLIGQVRFTMIVGSVQQYAGNYQGEHSTGPVPSRAWRQFEQEQLGEWKPPPDRPLQGVKSTPYKLAACTCGAAPGGVHRFGCGIPGRF